MASIRVAGRSGHVPRVGRYGDAARAGRATRRVGCTVCQPGVTGRPHRLATQVLRMSNQNGIQPYNHQRRQLSFC